MYGSIIHWLLYSDQSEKKWLILSVQRCGEQPDAHGYHMAGVRLTIYERICFMGWILLICLLVFVLACLFLDETGLDWTDLLPF